MFDFSYGKPSELGRHDRYFVPGLLCSEARSPNFGQVRGRDLGETIQSAVASGDKVAITGFGVFEKSERPARTARNPATGDPIAVAASSVPKFRPGADFKALVNGATGDAAKSAAKAPAKAGAKKK